ncbi:hypothetical protein LSH36_95g00075 [Paralvinella palmiformis]|uniref:Neurotransmitter-gated ion-channel transmembrane domain-containing protein n=1 Tax=Paralvinella palmiformis TaxID=53620 RepID=A0AAD9NBL1_9ANNE|nr:hypothetical protein LSH36_95g00075 [Paralvinella palmiformis]
MKLQKYPLDTQYCPMMFERYGYTMDTMYFSWLPHPVDLDPSVLLPQFKFQDSILNDCSQNICESFPVYKSSLSWSKKWDFMYIPTMLIVTLSWVAFFVGLLTVLAITTQSTNANSSLPKVSYVKAVDIWFLVCSFFVFAGLIEFVVANMMNRKVGKFQPDKCHREGDRWDGVFWISKGDRSKKQNYGTEDR